MSGKRGGLGRKITLTEADLEYAYQNCKSLSSAARFLNISKDTLKREAKKHRRKDTKKTYYELLKNPKGIGISKGGSGNPKLVKYPMEDILSGKYPDYNPYKLQERLLKNDIYLDRRCAVCSFFDVREDGKIPLKLDFINGDTTNHHIDNLRWLCYNHYYMLVGWHRKSLYNDRSQNRFDPKNIKKDDKK